MGCVNFTNKWFTDGVITEERIQNAILDGRRKLEWISDEYIAHGWQEAIGSSGTIKTIAGILTQNYDSHGVINYDNLKALADLCVQAGHVSHIILPGLSEDRAPIIIGGICVLMAAFEELQIESMVASEGALREGLLNDMIESVKGHDIRMDTVRDLELRYHLDVAQSGRICHTALHMFDQLDSKEDEAMRLMLLWAGRLHEIGLSISHNNYPSHSGYIVEQSDMPGFSREMQNTLGLMLRLQRGKLKMEMIQALPRLPGACVLNIILLRIAIILERSRDWDSSRLVKIKLSDNRIVLKFPKKYLKNYPLTKADLRQEAVEVSKAGYKLQVK